MGNNTKRVVERKLVRKGAITMFNDKPDVLKLKNDLVFKAVYGQDTEESKCALIGLLNAILERGDDPIIDVVHKNPYQTSRHFDDKETILDIKVEAGSGEIIDIEMQLYKQKDIRERFIFYHGGLIRESLKKGTDYDMMAPTITICIVDAVLFEETDGFLSKFYFMEEVNHFKFSEKTCIYCIELPKVNLEGKAVEELSILEVELEYLRNADENGSEYVEELVRRGGKELQMAQRMLKKATEEEILRERALAREKFEWDVQSRISHGYREGRKAGKEEGIKEGIKEGVAAVAVNLKELGISSEVISKSTGLSVEEIEKL